MKYSIIVCVYNGEKYIDTCLSTLLSQSYQNYEVLIINDGSTDRSFEKLKMYEKNEKVKIITQKNSGLSVARNVGVKKSKGDYFLFVDIDDKVPSHFLETIENNMEKDLDLLKFNYALTYDTKEKDDFITNFKGKVVSGEDAFLLLTEQKIPFELAVLYAYRKEFWEQNKFAFTKELYHEDYGLIPFVLLKSKNVKLIDDILYDYYQSEGSITRNDDYQKTLKKANDIYVHSCNLKEKVKHENISKHVLAVFNSYMANAILLKYEGLKKEDRTDYQKKIKKDHILDDLLADTLKRKIKKQIWKLKIR